MSSSDVTQQLSHGIHKEKTLSSEIMVAAFVFFFMTLVFVLFLYIYAKWRWSPGSAARRAQARADRLGPDQDLVATRRRGGLDQVVIEALPVSVYKLKDFKEGMECAVCLSELADGEKTRMLPKCNHGFHLDCIDMWFYSHSTCPLCRNPVGPQPPVDVEAGPLEAFSTDGYSLESVNLPTNVLFWGTQDQVSSGDGGSANLQEAPTTSQPTSSSERMLAIEIPRRVVEGLSSPLPSSRIAAEDMKSPAARLRSFRRLFVRDQSRSVGSSYSPYSPTTGVDIQQGVYNTTTPKTPSAS